MLEPIKFDDGSHYCDTGRHVVKRLFWWFHKEDLSECNCNGKQDTLGQITQKISGDIIKQRSN